ncbi:MAG TPA: hypothetical protein VLT47_11035 [Anaeromyxobacteraceae bacterium]|nr:hypothetical protein [Anaeromyxobacteraceae bacterium]
MAYVTADFLSAVKACTWQSSGGGSLRNASGATLYPYAAPSTGHSNAWTLAASGPTISESVYNQLVAGTTAGAHYAGEFVVSGTSYWLAEEYGIAGNRVAVLPDEPPPPPPP